jgi:hypothetical protein
MNTFSILLIVVAAAATLGAANSALALSYPPSYVEQTDDSYRSSHGLDRHRFDRGHEQFAFRGHDRRR